MDSNIFIGTPCFEHKVNSFYVHSLLDFAKRQINFEPFFIHDSLITRSRNNLITTFYENSDKFTHLLWLDSDVSISAEGLRILLDETVDVIAAPVPIKDFSLKNNQSIRNVYEEVRPYLYKAEAAATGCFLMSKKSATSLIESSEYYFDLNNPQRKIYNVFQSGIRDGELMSEDWDICYKLKDLGYEIYVNSSFPVLHYGICKYSRGPSLNGDYSKRKYM